MVELFYGPLQMKEIHFFEAECVIELLQSCNNDDLKDNLFIELLNELQDTSEDDADYLLLFQWDCSNVRSI